MGQDPGEIRAEVEEARENLGETVEALAYKANAPGRMKEDAAAKARAAKAQAATKVEEVKQQATTRVQDAKARIGSDSRTETARRRLHAISQNGRARTVAAVGTVRRHPSGAAAAALSLALGIVLGRRTSR
jgi:F0F1-type ATP synthase membrane subunit b/b'